MKKKILVTGCAGFIGYHLCKKLINKNFYIIGIDDLNNYYDINLKSKRLKELNKIAKLKDNQFIFVKEKIENKKSINELFKKHKPEVVVNLAAQAGVTYSIHNPDTYISSNIVGFLNILESQRFFYTKSFICSSSSVYGGNQKMPFSEDDSTNHPISLYAATKEQMN